MAKQATSSATTAVAKTTKASAPALAEFNPRDPQTLLATAAQLAQFVTDNKLASTIQGRAYVQAEGWQFLFAVAGLDVICSKPTRLREGRPDTEICYEAEARLLDAQGREVGYGSALCSTAESSKRTWAEYAINSMAQTRAIGKAGRNRFAFVMKAAGFEPTPAEEMSEVGTSAQVLPSQPAGNGAGGSPTASEPPVMRAESNSAAPVASDGADRSGPLVAETAQKLRDTLQNPAFSPEYREQQLARIPNALTEAKGQDLLKKLETFINQRALLAKAEQNCPVKESGTNTDLVDEYEREPIATAQGQPVELATSSQKEEIIRLTNHPLITRKEKSNLLLNLPKLDGARAAHAIDKLRNAIEFREDNKGERVRGLRESLHKRLRDHGPLLGEEIVGEYSLLVENAEATAAELEAALAEVAQVLDSNQEPDEAPAHETAIAA